jgi:hypothetical protein
MYIKEISSKSDLKSFIQFPFQLYKNDPFFSPQLQIDLKGHFSDKNPFLKHNKVRFFLAVEDKKILGRIVSIINYDHIKFHNEKVGFFGFFECINDNQVTSALLDRVSKEIKKEGLEKIRGPMNFSTNEECGFLLEGFDYPPMLMTPYNKAYYNDLMKNYGMVKSKDLYAFIYELKDELPEKVWRVASIAKKKGIKVRTVKKESFFLDMHIFQDIYNSAWSKNWGFIPLRDDELIYSAKRLKPIADFDLIFIAEKDGEAIGFLGLIPDFNFVLRKMLGRLNPVTIVKALYFKNKIKDLRLLLYGIKEEYRNKGVDALMFLKGKENIVKKRYNRIEFSWILEDNKAVIKMCELFGARLYKKYRIYEKKI